MKKRIGGAFSSPTIASASDLPEDNIYNVFPDIKDPGRRAYYLHVIDAMYFPIRYEHQLKELQFRSRVGHEALHSGMTGSFAIYKLRELAFLIMGLLTRGHQY
jgi:hypothetical protein